MSKSAGSVAYASLQRGIISGKYPPGTWLREDELAEESGVSRTPIREALQRLEAEGLVESYRNRGSVVVGWTADDIDALYDLRILVEGYGVRRAASRLDAVDFDALTKLCEESEALLPIADRSDIQRLGELSLDFHLTLQRGSGQRQLRTILPALLATPFVQDAGVRQPQENFARLCREHREILEALAAGDADWAEGALRAHLRRGRHSLRGAETPSLAADGGKHDTSVRLSGRHASQMC
jgi:DNA-binding GntR family transcriptional regulator